jgi:hypothetical protein
VVPACGNTETTDGNGRRHEHDATVPEEPGAPAQPEGSAPAPQVGADRSVEAGDSAGSTLRQVAGDSSTVCAAAAVTTAGVAVGNAVEPRMGRPRFGAPWIDWATLLKRVWNTDALACPCGGRLKLVKLVTDEAEASQALRRAGLPSEPPPIARARSPTFFDEPPPDWE